MPSNLPPITQNLLSSVQQMRTEQLATLGKITGLSIGSTVMAVVEQIAPASQSQRDLLLAQNQQLLAQLQQKPLTPAIKLQIAGLLEKQQLLSSPPLKLAQLQLNNRSLLTYTDQPLQPGQQIPVKLDAQQRLVQLFTALDARPIPSAGTSTEPDINIATKTHSAVTHARAQTQEALAEALRTLLPQKEKPQALLNLLPHLQHLPIKQRDQLLPTNVQQALRSVADQIRSLPQLTSPKLLAMVLKNSGVQFEQKLAATVSPAPDSRPAEKNRVAPPANPITPRLISQDYKGALLHLLHQLGQALGNAASAANQGQPTASINPAALSPDSASTTQALHPSMRADFAVSPPLQFPTALQLLQHLATRPQADLSDKVLRTQLLLLLHQHTLTSLAKVQLQQLHSLNHQQGQVDSPQPTQSWLFDIPVRYGSDIHPLEIRIDQEWVNDDKGEENQRDKVKQWSVMLSFNLPRLGGLYAQLTVLDNAVSAKLWAEEASTLAQAQASLEELRQQLKSQGVEVKQLQCLSGPPPSRSVSLNYALVDIKT